MVRRKPRRDRRCLIPGALGLATGTTVVPCSSEWFLYRLEARPPRPAANGPHTLHGLAFLAFASAPVAISVTCINARLYSPRDQWNNADAWTGGPWTRSGAIAAFPAPPPDGAIGLRLSAAGLHRARKPAAFVFGSPLSSPQSRTRDQRRPKASIASATLRKPAMFAPRT